MAASAIAAFLAAALSAAAFLALDLSSLSLLYCFILDCSSLLLKEFPINFSVKIYVSQTD